MQDSADQVEWLTAARAAEIISRNSGREVSPDYLNQLVRLKKLEPRKLDARTNLYRSDQVEKIRVRGRYQKQPKTEKSGE